MFACILAAAVLVIAGALICVVLVQSMPND